MTVEITPRNAYFAKDCPQRVQLEVLRPCEPLPDPPFLQKLFTAGDEYEEDAFATLFTDVPGATVVAADDPGIREVLTTQALAGGSPVVAGGRLPVDVEAHRVGEPDLLVLDANVEGEATDPGYLPVDVKSHKVLDVAKEPGAGSALVSELTAPAYEAACRDPEHDARWRTDDLLQLAHYRRLLERAGVASSDRNLGGIYGSEGVIVWYDLDEPCLDPSEYFEAPSERRLSAMELYDLEFAHRLAVHVAALEHAADGSAPLLAEPVACTKCDMCRWRGWCGAQLEEVADLSLVSGVGAARRRMYKAHGIDDLHELAALDWTTAELARCKVDLDHLLDEAKGLPPSTPLADVVANRKKQLENLATHGVRTVAELTVIDQETLGLFRAGATNLSTQIDLARARTGPAPAYRRRGLERIEVPRADVEVDVDMENADGGCYLWGALVTDRRGARPSTRYVPFATWDPDLGIGELAAFSGFWTWFVNERSLAHEDGATFRAYCYSRGAEEGQMRPIADRLGIRDEVDEFLASDEWVDLYEVTRTQLVTGRRMGLKETAPLAGFAWRFDDVGGSLAMVKYDVAVDDSDPEAQAEARRWILEYNEDDVRATAALREWLDGPGRDLPSIGDAAA